MARQDTRMRSEDSFLLEMDKIGISMGMLLLCISCIYLPLNWLHHPKCMQAVRQMMLVIVIKLLYYRWCSTHSWFYKHHRFTSLLVLNGLEYGACLLYIPICFEVAVADQLAAGRANTFAYNMLLSGLSSFEIALQCLALRLPLRYAGPLAGVKMVLAMQLLPGQIDYLHIPEVDVIFTSFKNSVDAGFSVLAAAVAPVDIRSTITSAPCPKVALFVWVHLCLAGLLPLYILFVTQAAIDNQVTPRVPASSSTTSLGQLQQERYGSSTAAASLGCIGSSSSSYNDTSNSRGSSSSSHAQYAVQASQQQQQDDIAGNDWFVVQTGNKSWADTCVAWCCHAVVLLLSGLVLWAVVEIAAVLFGSLAARHGMCM